MTGQGGWPMTVVLDHDGSPFFAGTYFPDRPRGGQPSLRQVLDRTDRGLARPARRRTTCGRVGARAPRPARSPSRRRRADRAMTSTPPSQSLAGGLRRGAWRLRRRAEVPAEHGARAAPPPHRRARRGAMLDRTLEAMARGGIHDQLGGGFARYSVDAAWVVPHFEKMLYDNAQLVGLYARWGTPLGDRVAADTADWMLRELRTPEGGFASALDADSEGEEGRFYVWTPEQLADVLGEDDGRLGDRGCSRSPAPSSTAPRPCSCRATPTTPGRPLRRRTPPAAGRPREPGPAGARRQGGRRLERPGDRRPRRRRPAARPRGVRRRRARRAGDLLAGIHLVDGRLRRVSRDGRVGIAGRRARGLRRRGRRLPGPVRRDRRRALAGPRDRLLDDARSPTSGPTTAASSTPRPTASGWSPGRATRATTPARRAPRPRSTRCSPRTRSPATGAGSTRPRRRWPGVRAGPPRAPLRRVVPGGGAVARRRRARDRGGRASRRRRATRSSAQPGPGRVPSWPSPTGPARRTAARGARPGRRHPAAYVCRQRL